MILDIGETHDINLGILAEKFILAFYKYFRVVIKFVI